MNKLLSVVIPARTEFPNIIHTIYSILHCWEADGFDPKDIEIIVVDNASRDWEDPKFDWTKPGTRGTTTYFMPRGCFYSGVVRVLYDPIAGNHSARNKGAAIATGKYLFFSDAHMAYKPGFFKYAMKACDESGGMVHGVIGWMGAYPPHEGGLGFQYTIKLGEEIKGTWAPYCLTQDSWFYIPAQGHCSVFVNAEQFRRFQGYNKVHRTYGGGEFYTNMKWWMLGGCVVVEPRAIGYHLASGRGYSYHHNDYIENVLGIAYALGMDDWRERAYINWMRHTAKGVMDKIMNRNEIEYGPERLWLEKKRRTTFNDMLKIKTEYNGKVFAGPWNKKNFEKFGKCNGGVLIFHDTWLNLLKDSRQEVRDAYKNSKYQGQLEGFINENLSEFIYKRNPQAPVKASDILGI